MPNPLDDAKVYTLADLKVWETLRPGLPPSLAVLGHPVAHSVSPQMHNAALAELAKTHPELKDWRYFKFDIKPEELEEALELLKVKCFKGINFTIPHKFKAAELLTHGRIDRGGTGSVNTYTSISNGWEGTTTDDYGFKLALEETLRYNLINSTVVILGAGGAAWSAAKRCIRADCSEMWIGNRDRENGKHFWEQLIRESGRPGEGTLTINEPFDIYQPPVEKWPKNILLINATSLGLKPDDPLPIEVEKLPLEATVFDMVYRKGGTSLVAAARARGLRATDGLSMLVWQGAKSLSIWLQSQAALDIQAEALAPTMMTAACSALGLPPRHA